jgi:hypothetical protein
VIRYLATSGDARIACQRTNEAAYWYVNSNFLPNCGAIFDNRRSTTGYCAFLAGACVDHASRRQATIYHH